MNITLKWNGRVAICQHCEKEIGKDEPVLLQQFFNAKKKWRMYNRFHPNCWLERQLYLLSDTPKPITARGRPRLPMSETEKKQRRLLMQSFSYWKNREGPLAVCKRNEICKKLADLGGIPQDWDLTNS